MLCGYACRLNVMHLNRASVDSHQPANLKKKSFLITYKSANKIRCEVLHCDVGGRVVTGRITLTIITTSRSQKCQRGAENKSVSSMHSQSDASEHPVC